MKYVFVVFAFALASTPAWASCQQVCYTDSSGRTVCHTECHSWTGTGGWGN